MMARMTTSIDVTIDVTDAAGLGEPLHTRATVTLPDPATHQPDRPVVCFGFPGGGYSRQYFTFDMPDGVGGGQAGWHAARGWVFVAVDHPVRRREQRRRRIPTAADVRVVAAANAATVAQVPRPSSTARSPTAFPPVPIPSLLGIGQSMGGCFTIVQQGRHATYDGIGVLGFSAHPDRAVVPARHAEPIADAFALRDDGLPIVTWCFHYDDEPADIVGRGHARLPDCGRRTFRSGARRRCRRARSQMLEPGCVTRRGRRDHGARARRRR